MDEVPEDVVRHTDQVQSTVHHVLRASRRRLVIVLVAYRLVPQNPHDTRSTEQISVRQLAREIVAIENELPKEHATGDDYHNAYTALIQTHLPLLDDVGAIQYDQNRKRIEPDRNLLPLAVAASTTSSVTQLIFYRAIADLYRNGMVNPEDSITD